MKASGHSGLAVCSCCGSVRLFGHETAVSVYAAFWLGSVYVCNRHLTTQTQQAAKEKRWRRRSVVLTASSLSNPFTVIIYLMCFFSLALYHKVDCIATGSICMFVMHLEN